MMQVLTALSGGDGTGRGLQLEVRHTPASPRPPDTVPGFLKLTEGATLNLSCEVAGPDPAEAAEVSLSWYLPNHAAIDKQRLEQRGGEAGAGRSTLVIAPLMEADTGDYECWAQAPATSTQVKKILKVRTTLCLTIEYCIAIVPGVGGAEARQLPGGAVPVRGPGQAVLYRHPLPLRQPRRLPARRRRGRDAVRPRALQRWHTAASPFH